MKKFCEYVCTRNKGGVEWLSPHHPLPSGRRDVERV